MVRWVYRHFPLANHDRARPAATASECAQDQSMFIAYHDLIYATTDAGGLTILTDAQLQQHATTLGLDRNDFDPCLDGSSKDDRIDRDMTSGAILGVTGTPTFFVNGEQASRLDVKDVIDRKLNEANGG